MQGKYLKTAMKQHLEYSKGLQKDICKYLNILWKESIVQNKTSETTTTSNKDEIQVDKVRNNRHASRNLTRKDANHDK